MGSYIELPKSLQRQGLINIKNIDNYCFKQLNRDLLNESFHVCAEHSTIIRSITPDDCRVLCTYMKRFVE